MLQQPLLVLVERLLALVHDRRRGRHRCVLARHAWRQNFFVLLSPALPPFQTAVSGAQLEELFEQKEKNCALGKIESGPFAHRGGFSKELCPQLQRRAELELSVGLRDGRSTASCPHVTLCRCTALKRCMHLVDAPAIDRSQCLFRTEGKAFSRFANAP